jgi:hypothetical protein
MHACIHCMHVSVALSHLLSALIKQMSQSTKFSNTDANGQVWNESEVKSRGNLLNLFDFHHLNQTNLL